jgi:hypothetical protein
MTKQRLRLGQSFRYCNQMSTKHAPATPLPWHRYNQDRGSIHFGRALETITGDDDLDFAIHACNAYPKLIEILNMVTGDISNLDPKYPASFESGMAFMMDKAEDLKKELGES